MQNTKMIRVFLAVAVIGFIVTAFATVPVFPFTHMQAAAVSFGVNSFVDNDCIDESPEFHECHQHYYGQIVNTLGVRAAINDVRWRFETSRITREECHHMAHMVGLEVAKSLTDIPSILLAGDYLCQGGYYHGALEVVLEPELLPGSEPDFARVTSLCDSMILSVERRLDLGFCVHGLGHAIMQLTDQDLERSLDTCNAYFADKPLVFCWDGVFMENMLSGALRPTDPLYPCNAVEMQYRLSCYKFQGLYVIETVENDFQAYFELCEQETDPNSRAGCYQYIALTGTWRQHMKNFAETTKNICMLAGSDEQRDECIFGGGMRLITIEFAPDNAKKLCEMLESPSRVSCEQRLDMFFESYMRDR